MLTPGQIIAALQVSSAVTLNNSAAPFNTIQTSDITNWTGALGLNPATDTASLIFNIINPLGLPVYTNPGWNTSNFSAPDTIFSNTPNLTGPLETLPILTGSPTNEVLSGAYTVYVKFSVVQGSNPAVVGQTSFSTVVEANLLLRTGCMSASYSCNTSPTTFTANDLTGLTTSLYAFVSVTRTITITPPVVSGQTPTSASGNTLTINNLWAPAPYQYNVVGLVRYTLGLDTFAVNYTANGFTDVVCNTILCKMYCWLTNISKDFLLERNTTKKNELEQQLVLGNVYYDQAVRAQICGDNKGFEVAVHTFAKVTWFDGNCTCCDNMAPAPVIPSGQVGPPGADGKTAQFQTLGGWVQWKYTTDLAWTNLYQIPAGTPGTPGLNGANGSSLIYGGPVVGAVITDVPTTTSGSFETLSSFSTDKTNPAHNLVNVGDEIRLYALYRAISANPTADMMFVQVLINGTGLTNEVVAIGASASQADFAIEVYGKLILTDNTAGAMRLRCIIEYKTYQKAFGTLLSQSTPTAVQVRDFGGATCDFSANNYLFSAQAKSVNAGDTELSDFSGEKLATGNGAATGITVDQRGFIDDASAANATPPVPLGSYYINSATGSITKRLT